MNPVQLAQHGLCGKQVEQEYIQHSPCKRNWKQKKLSYLALESNATLHHPENPTGLGSYEHTAEFSGYLYMQEHTKSPVGYLVVVVQHVALVHTPLVPGDPHLYMTWS